MVASGDDLLVSTVNGIENITANRADAVITTPLHIGKSSQVEVSYYKMPTDTSISIETNSDGEGWVEHEEIIDDEDEKKVFITSDVVNGRDLQARITLHANTTTSPTIDKIIIQD